MTSRYSIRFPVLYVSRQIVALLVATLMVGLTGNAVAALPSADVEFVIVTNSELAPEFETLAAFKTDIGISTRVVTLDWIGAQVAPGGDLPATIRGFLQEARSQWGTRYVLLGGDLSVVPTRWVFDDFYPTVGGTDIPTDLYYAGLDGDWDADGDGIFGEPYESAADPGDDADMAPDLALGRAPVGTTTAAALFVAKTIAFHLNSASLGLPPALLVADVLFPSNWQPGGYVITDGAITAEELRGQLESADPPWVVDRQYENYLEFAGSDNATAASFLAAISAGDYRLVHHYAFTYGDTLEVGQDLVTGEQLAELSNSEPFFFVVLGSRGAAFDDDSAIVRTLLAPDGGCAAGLGSTRASFASAIARYHEAFYRHALAEPGARVGDALRNTLVELVEPTFYDYVDRWTHQTLVLLGDPTLPLSAVELPVAIDDRGPGPDDNDLPDPLLTERLTATPNPFNPLLEIGVELPVDGQVRLSICDVRGRELRVLFDGQHAAGRANWQWNGTDHSGRAVASGVYLLRLETKRRIMHRAVTLAR